ncbi:DUF2726 domain-containing protein [Marichromatium bheemlicum]|uniref:DUF2726 domain-containing protein n=1 Tax=Marichromatium bheemlicum TaxID=365339 RepID=A0ABX1I693_9GAMM|nr:DUF2726 domain-containing protein [Marichromatium bheemlicum]NKN33084.1 DUF2726 domain-containing protein [Marichromatium bheemlicum]
MAHFYLLLGLTALVLLAFAFSLWRALSPRNRRPYVLSGALLTSTQRAFAHALEQCLDDRYRLYARVPATEVLAVARRTPKRWRERAEWRLGERCFDFLICDAATSKPCCALALSPAGWLRRREPPRDQLDTMCATAGLPLLRFLECEHYAPGDLAPRLRTVLGATGRAAPRSRARPSDPPQPKVVVPTLGGARAEPVLGEVGPADVTEGPRFRIDEDVEIGADRREPALTPPRAE